MLTIILLQRRFPSLVLGLRGLNFPCLNFKGGDPFPWIARAKKIFVINRVKEEEKIQLAYISMEGEVVHWYCFIRCRTPCLSWSSLGPLMLQRFGVTIKGNVFDRLTTLAEEGTVADYLWEFEALVAQILKPSDDEILGFHGPQTSGSLSCAFVPSYRFGENYGD